MTLTLSNIDFSLLKDNQGSLRSCCVRQAEFFNTSDKFDWTKVYSADNGCSHCVNIGWCMQGYHEILEHG